MQQVLQQNLGWFFLTLENLFLRGFILKPTERAYVLVKNGTRDFQNSPPFGGSACFHVAITENFKGFQYLNFEKDFLENRNLFQKTGARFLIESTKIEKCIISIQNCHVRNQC